MSDQPLSTGHPATGTGSQTNSFAPPPPSLLTRYERRSGSLPHLEDQPDIGQSHIDLPTPVASRLRPLDRLRSLIG